MGQLSALRTSCGARGVEDAGIAIGVDVDHGLLCVAGDNLAPGGNATVRCGKSNPNNFDIWHAGAVLAQLLQSLLIENHYLGG